MKILLITTAAIGLGACSTPPAPICDRAAQTYDKFGTPEAICHRPKPRPVKVPGKSQNSN